jgi:hypothetical protein
MAKSSPIQTNFTAGELSPRLDGRTDIAKYDNGCEILENFIVHPQGGATRRPGTKFIKESRAGVANTEARLIPFSFNTDQSYAIEFNKKKAEIIYEEGTLVYPDRRYYDSDQYANLENIYSNQNGVIRDEMQFSDDGFTAFHIHYLETKSGSFHKVEMFFNEYHLGSAYSLPTAVKKGEWNIELNNKHACNLQLGDLILHAGFFWGRSSQLTDNGNRFFVWDGMSSSDPSVSTTNVVDFSVYEFDPGTNNNFTLVNYWNTGESPQAIGSITSVAHHLAGSANTSINRYPIPITGLAVLPNFDTMQLHNTPLYGTHVSNASDGVTTSYTDVDDVGGFWFAVMTSHLVSPNASHADIGSTTISPNEILIIPIAKQNTVGSDTFSHNWDFASATFDDFPQRISTSGVEFRSGQPSTVSACLRVGDRFRPIYDPHGVSNPARTVVTGFQILSIRDYWIYYGSGKVLWKDTDKNIETNTTAGKKTIAHENALDAWSVHADATHVMYISTLHNDSAGQPGEQNIFAIPFKFTNNTSLQNADFLDEDAVALSCAQTYGTRSDSNFNNYTSSDYPGQGLRIGPSRPFVTYNGEMLVYNEGLISYSVSNIATIAQLKYPYYIFGLDTSIMGISSTQTVARVDEVLGTIADTTFSYTQSDVLEPNNPFQVATPFDDDELKDIKFAQSADVLYLVHPNHPPQSFIRWAANEWTCGTTELEKGPMQDRFFDGSYMRANGRSGQVTITWQPGQDSSGWLATDFGRIVKLHNGYAVLDVVAPTDGSQTAIATVLENDDGDALLMPEYTATTISFHDGDPSATGLEHNDRIHDSSGNFLEKGFKKGMRITITGASNSANNQSGLLIVDATEDTLLLAPSNSLTTAQAGPSITVVGDLTNDEEYRLGAFSETTGYPSIVALYERRLIFGNTLTQPQTLFFSEAGLFQSFKPGVEATDAITYTLASNQVNIIQYAVASRLLVIGTTGGEFVVSSGSSEEVITPTNIQIRRQANYGSADVQPVAIGSAILFVQRGGRKVRELVYNYDTDSYYAPDLTLLAEHITDQKIQEVVWQQEPDSVLWARLGDGTLCSMTYRREEEVIAWHRHVIGSEGYFDGFVESLCVVPSSAGEDELYMIVRRIVSGSTERHVEKLSTLQKLGVIYQGAPPDYGAYLDNSMSSLVFLPSSNPTLGNLSHLEGKTVTYIADRKFKGTAVVSNGEITVDSAIFENAVGTYFIGTITVGLPYSSTLKTMRMDTGGVEGTSQAKTKRIREVSVRFLDTLDAKVGPSESNLKTVTFDKPEYDPIGGMLPLFSGDKTVEFHGDYETDGFVVVRQDEPLPMTILAIMPLLQTFDR